MVQCVTLFIEPVELPTCSLVEKFHSVQEEDVGPAIEMAEEACGVPTRNSRGPMPEHLVDLYGKPVMAVRLNENAW